MVGHLGCSAVQASNACQLICSDEPVQGSKCALQDVQVRSSM
jgi:hypothetical protein